MSDHGSASSVQTTKATTFKNGTTLRIKANSIRSGHLSSAGGAPSSTERRSRQL